MNRVSWKTKYREMRALISRMEAACNGGGIESYVAGILEDIRAHGLEALRRYSQEFDGFGGPFRVPEDEVEGSGQLLPQGVRESIERVVERVTEHHRLQVRGGNELYVKDGSLYGILRRPIRRIGIYVPGGGKPLPLH